MRLRNTNCLFDSEGGYYDEAASGVKTGTTRLAGGCLISTFTVGGHDYLCGVMDGGYDGRYTNTKALAAKAAE